MEQKRTIKLTTEQIDILMALTSAHSKGLMDKMHGMNRESEAYEGMLTRKMYTDDIYEQLYRKVWGK